jgi:hypothetical protein
MNAGSSVYLAVEGVEWISMIILTGYRHEILTVVQWLRLPVQASAHFVHYGDRCRIHIRLDNFSRIRGSRAKFSAD